jgi:predicted membrane channel-forming protein YqfA (hemolysin III family)
MDWGGVRNAKLVAGGYLVAFAAMVIGLVILVPSLGTGGGNPVRITGIVLFAASQLILFWLSIVLRTAMPARRSRLSPPDRRGAAWNRLALGLELTRAWRVVRR